MTPERWQQIEQLLHAALELNPEERAAFLDHECAGDEELREELESLLASSKPARAFLEAHAIDDAAELMKPRISENVLIGSAFGPYVIQKPLGTGGMGEVYLAQDTRLNRKVALKLLNPALANEKAGRTRFLREAQLASGLDHPNICTVHEVGEIDDRPFIAMQYIEGLTLKQVVTEQQLSLDTILSISLQVADALSFAHENGVVHRDIKSANIMITSRGQAKVLDLGLAKSVEQAEALVDTQLTMTGAVMGTPAFMSPEQARGEAADHRSDIFSFGVVLYEMATGRTPFNGRSKADVISAVLKEQQTPASQLNKEIPQRFSSLIDRALEKDPNERFQSISTMLVELRRVVTEAGGLDRLFGSSETQRANVASIPIANISSFPSKWARKHVVLASLLGAALVGALGIAVYRARPTPALGPSPEMRISRLTTVGTATAATISPDGKYIVYATGEAVTTQSMPQQRWSAGRSSLWVKQLSTNRTIEIIPPADVKYRGTTFSPDGELIYYVMVDKDNPQGALFRVSVLGGESRKVLDQIFGPIAFSPDGKQFAFFRTNWDEGSEAFIVANVDGSNERTLAVRKGNDWFEEDGPSWSPDGKIIACAIGTDIGGTSMTVLQVPAQGGELTAITSRKWGGSFGRVAWLSDGTGMIVIAQEGPGDSSAGTDTQLWQISYPGGEARRITNDLSGYSHTSLGLTNDSRALVTAQVDTYSRIWLAAFDRSSTVEAGSLKPMTSGRFDGRYGVSWMPDGRVVYVTRTGEAEDIWIMNADGSGQKQLTDDPAFDETPTTSPDGRYIYFASTRSGNRQIWRMNADGSNAKQLTAGEAISGEPACSPDGKWVAFSSWRSGKNALWKMPADGGEPMQLTDSPSSRPIFSPDGKFISCVYLDEQLSRAQWRLATIPSNGGRPIKVFEVDQTINAMAGLWWTTDSRALIYIDTRNGVSNVWQRPLADRPAKQLTHFDSGQIFDLAISSDGQRIALARGTMSSDVVMISNFK